MGRPSFIIPSSIPGLPKSCSRHCHFSRKPLLCGTLMRKRLPIAWLITILAVPTTLDRAAVQRSRLGGHEKFFRRLAVDRCGNGLFCIGPRPEFQPRWNEGDAGITAPVAASFAIADGCRFFSDLCVDGGAFIAGIGGHESGWRGAVRSRLGYLAGVVCFQPGGFTGLPGVALRAARCGAEKVRRPAQDHQ